MPVISIQHLEDPRIADYRNVPDPVLLRERNLFVAEGRLVVRTLLERSPYRTRSLLVTQPALASLHDLLESHSALPVYLAAQPCLNAIAGFNIHRGCLALGERPAPVAADDLLDRISRPALLVVLEGIGNPDNVGGIFRNARAFGVDAVLIGPGCCDPLYRKAIRVSLGASLCVPFSPLREWPQELGALAAMGIELVALTPEQRTMDVGIWAHMKRAAGGTALLVGAEGEGLSSAALSYATVRVRIAMAPGIDSLNVATAAAIALHRLWDRG